MKPCKRFACPSHQSQTVANPLPQLVREIETQAIQAQQQISLARGQLTAKQREMRLAQLTQSEIGSLPKDTPVYEGVGKMYVILDSKPLRQSSSLPFCLALA